MLTAGDKVLELIVCGATRFLRFDRSPAGLSGLSKSILDDLELSPNETNGRNLPNEEVS
jgi:hypothetical protein